MAGAEVAALGRDLENLVDRCSDVAHRAEGLQLRLERLSNRVNMRLNRAGAARDDDGDARILEEIRRTGGNGQDFEDPFFGR